MIMMSILENAISLAMKSHKGQRDLAGNPYILHPFHVMDQLHTIEEKIVGVLHDVTEDTKMTLDELMKSITKGLKYDDTWYDSTREALLLLDKGNFKDYEEMIVEISFNPWAKRVKIEDLQHNMDLKRIIGKEDMNEKDMKRFSKYLKSLTYLTQSSEEFLQYSGHVSW